VSVPSALVLGGVGLIGRAAVPALAANGFDVTVAHRGNTAAPEAVTDVARVVHLDREDDAALRRALGGGVDVVVDIVCMRPAHAGQLRALGDLVGSLVVISSAAVYADDEGRELLNDEAARPPMPVSEGQRRADADDETYAGRKRAVEDILLAGDAPPTTILRPGAIYGPGDVAAREWYLVKRVLDGRTRLVLAFGGESRFHQTASANLGELIRLAAAHPGRRALNAVDAEAWTVRETAAGVGRALGHAWDETLLDGPPPSEQVGSTPWSVPNPFVLDMAAARQDLGYADVIEHDTAVAVAAEWLVEATRDRDWREVLPRAATYYGVLFDYEAEDAFLAGPGY
jgi:nucleoside-diphosphate-sugar epimerase